MSPLSTFVASLGLIGLGSAAILPKLNSYPGHDLAMENRTLDEIYAAAKNESGELIVLWGGDGMDPVSNFCSLPVIYVDHGAFDIKLLAREIPPLLRGRLGSPT